MEGRLDFVINSVIRERERDERNCMANTEATERVKRLHTRYCKLKDQHPSVKVGNPLLRLTWVTDGNNMSVRFYAFLAIFQPYNGGSF